MIERKKQSDSGNATKAVEYISLEVQNRAALDIILTSQG